ncbi:MAG: hypothetical protein V1917_00455 [Candidatus Gottesmanbacteria bacterium]
MIQHEDLVWSYLTKEQRVLVDDGVFLMKDSLMHKDQEPTDYSYLVFPFAKLYEGFLKDVFLQLGVISSLDYVSNRFRIGKVLNPNIVKQLHGKSVFGQLRNRYGIELAEHLWYAWKQGRNLVFHYFPSNFRMLSREQALSTIELLTDAMHALLKQTQVVRIK